MLILLTGLFGLLIGSFLNVCIARIPAGESVVAPPSHCPSCGAAIQWHDNVPVVGYVVLGGRCRTCQKPISLRYPLVEVLTAALFALQAWWVGPDLVVLAHHLLFTAGLIVLFGTDYDVQRLPDVITLPGIVFGIAFSLWVEPPGPLASIAGALAGAVVLLSVRWGWKRVTGVDGMGLGDVKMLAMVGAFLGWQQVGVVLFLASLAGACAGVALAALARRSLQTRLPFGTFLAAAAYVASLVGEDLLTWYLAFYR